MCVGAVIGGVGDNSGFTTVVSSLQQDLGSLHSGCRDPIVCGGLANLHYRTQCRGERMGPWLEKARRNKRVASRERERERGGGPRATQGSGEGRDKGNSRAEKLCFLLVQWQAERAARYPRSRPHTVKCNCGAEPAPIRARMLRSYTLLAG